MRGVVLAALLLSACATRAPAPAPDPPTADEAACRAEARDSPERNRLAARRFTHNADLIEREMAVAEQRAYRDCLRRRGGVESGGVEPLRR